MVLEPIALNGPDFDDPEIPGANDDGAPLDSGSIFPGSRGPLKTLVAARGTTFSSAAEPAGKTTFECTLRVYPAR